MSQSLSRWLHVTSDKDSSTSAWIMWQTQMPLRIQEGKEKRKRLRYFCLPKSPIPPILPPPTISVCVKLETKQPYCECHPVSDLCSRQPGIPGVHFPSLFAPLPLPSAMWFRSTGCESTLPAPNPQCSQSELGHYLKTKSTKDQKETDA